MRLTCGEKFFGTHGMPLCSTPFKMLHPNMSLPTEVDEAETLYAFVNHGRWMVKCPYCPSAQVAFELDRRFLCADCGNANNNGKYINVTWPNDNQREQIEKLLMKRKLANRN